MHRGKRKYTVWIGGNQRMDTQESSKASALQNARNRLGVKRLPEGTCAIAYEPGYFEKIADENRRLVKGTGLCTTDLY